MYGTTNLSSAVVVQCLQSLRETKELSRLSRNSFHLGGLRKEVHNPDEIFHSLPYFSYPIKRIEIAILRTRGEREVKKS